MGALRTPSLHTCIEMGVPEDTQSLYTYGDGCPEDTHLYTFIEMDALRTPSLYMYRDGCPEDTHLYTCIETGRPEDTHLYKCIDTGCPEDTQSPYMFRYGCPRGHPVSIHV